MELAIKVLLASLAIWLGAIILTAVLYLFLRRRGIHIPSRQTRTESDSGKCDYDARRRLLTPAEFAFFDVLKEAVPDFDIFPKVRVADVISARQRFSGAFLSISQKHFDWVLCDKATSRPLAFIELDDSSHFSSPDRIKSDRVKNGAARQVDVPLIRFRCAQNYEVSSIKQTIYRALP